MSMIGSQFWSNLVKTFTPKVDGEVVYAEHLNEATDEIEAIETILGTGVRARTSVTYSPSSSSWTNLTSRLNNIDAGVRATDVAVHPQYAVKDGTVLQPTTDTAALIVSARAGGTSDVARFVGADGTTTPLVVQNTSVSLRTPNITGTTTIQSASGVALNAVTDPTYTGATIRVQQGTTTTASVGADGSAAFTSLTVSGRLAVSDFTLAQHTHTSPEQGGTINPPGSIIMWAGGPSAVPSGWLKCDGALVSRVQNAGLFAVIGTFYGAGDGSTTFALPSLVGRFPIGAVSGSNPGVTGGSSSVGLTTTHLPSHSHSYGFDLGTITTTSYSHSHLVDAAASGAVTSSITFNYLAGGTATGSRGSKPTLSDVHQHSITIPPVSGGTSLNGSGQPFSVMNPYINVHFLIKT